MSTILYAGCDDAARLEIAALAEGFGHTIVHAQTGQEAYEVVLETAPDLAILDANLAVYSGFDLCLMLRGDPEVSQELPIFIRSTEEVSSKRLDECEATGCLKAGMSSHEVQELFVGNLAYTPSHTE